jgi:hypothetical protein
MKTEEIKEKTPAIARGDVVTAARDTITRLRGATFEVDTSVAEVGASVAATCERPFWSCSKSSRATAISSFRS